MRYEGRPCPQDAPIKFVVRLEDARISTPLYSMKSPKSSLFIGFNFLSPFSQGQLADEQDRGYEKTRGEGFGREGHLSARMRMPGNLWKQLWGVRSFISFSKRHAASLWVAPPFGGAPRHAKFVWAK